MPGIITPLGHGRYRVTWGGKVTARSTTKTKAESQLRLLWMVEYRQHPGVLLQAKIKAKRRVSRAKRVRNRNLGDS